MILAVFVSCILDVAGNQNCKVSLTDMSELASDKQTCKVVGTKLQDNARNSAMRGVTGLIGGRKEVFCGYPTEMMQKANEEYNRLRNRGIPTDLTIF